MNILHDKPIDGLAVFAVDAGCFDEFCFDAGDGVGVGVGVEVDCESVYHFGCLWLGAREAGFGGKGVGNRNLGGGLRRIAGSLE
jgi:hypothetical protein